MKKHIPTPARIFILTTGAILAAFITYLFLSPAGISKFSLIVAGENLRSPVAAWGEAGEGLSWEVPFRPKERDGQDRGEKISFEAELPISALRGKITIAARPAESGSHPASIQSWSTPDFPGQILRPTAGRMSWKVLERDPTGTRSGPEKWRGFLSLWGNSLLILGVAVSGAGFAGLLLYLFPEKIIINWSLLLAVGMATLILIELFLRGYLPPPHRYYCWRPHQRVVFHPGRGIMPGITGKSHFNINSQGIRGDEWSEEDNHRILAVGGSTTECKYLDQAEAWPQILQELLNKEDKNAGFWVGNIGHSGHGTREHLMQIKYLLPQIPGLEIVILLCGINDLALRLMRGEDYDSGFLATPRGKDAAIRRAFTFKVNRNPFLPNYQRSACWRILRDLIRTPRPGSDPSDRELIEDKAGANYARRRARRRRAVTIDTLPDLSAALTEYADNLNAIIDLVQARGIRLIMLTQPYIWRDDLSPEEKSLLWIGGSSRKGAYYSIEALSEGMEAYNRRMMKVCKERGIEVMDIAGVLPRDITVFYDDVHFNETGARLLAEKIAEYLSTHPSLPSAPTPMGFGNQ